MALLNNGVAYSFHVRAVNGVGAGPDSATVIVTPRYGSTYVPLIQTIILDTGVPIGHSGGLPIAQAPIAARTPLTFDVAGQSAGDPLRNVPAGATAVTGILSVSHGPVGAFLSLTPDPLANPQVSNLNFPANDKRSTGVTVTLGPGGTLSVTYAGTSIGAVDVTFEVTGYFIDGTTGATYNTVTPTRILDSRTGEGQAAKAKFLTNAHQCFQVTGRAGIPVGSDIVAVTGNLTVTNQTSSGKLVLGPDPQDAPATATIYAPKWLKSAPDTRATGVTIKLGTDGTLCAVWVGDVAGSTADVLFDVNGYFANNSTGAMYVPVAPNRILDTRVGLGTTRLSGMKSKSFLVVNLNPTNPTINIPVNAIAVTGTLTVTQQQAPGYLSLMPARLDRPTTSTLNFLLDNRATGVTAVLGSGRLWLTYGASVNKYTQAVFDVSGYFVNETTSVPTPDHQAGQRVAGPVAL